jgi:hypothetical protein
MIRTADATTAEISTGVGFLSHPEAAVPVVPRTT